MDKEKEIEEMEKLLCSMNQKFSDKESLKCGAELYYKVCPLIRVAAKELIEADYGNVKQAVNEFAEKLKEHFSNYFDSQYIDDLFKELYDEEKSK